MITEMVPSNQGITYDRQARKLCLLLGGHRD